MSRDARNFTALHFLGVVCHENGKLSESEQFFLKARSINSKFPPLFYNYGLCLAKEGRHQEAIKQFNTVANLSSNFFPVYCDRGAEFYKLKDLTSALRDYDKALSLKPDLAEAWLGRGNVFHGLKRFDEALAAFDRALSLAPDLENAWLGRGNVFFDQRLYDEALAAYDKALALKPDLENAWLGRANVFHALARYEEAGEAFDKALAFKPDLAEAWLGRGNSFAIIRVHAEALIAYDRALALDPNLENAWLGRSNVFRNLKRYEEAFAACEKAIALKPDLAEAWQVKGDVFAELKRYEESLPSYDKALALNPELTAAEGSRLSAKMHICDWSGFDERWSRLSEVIKSKKAVALPFSFNALSSSIEEQLQCATSWVAERVPLSKKTLWHGEIYHHDRIRVGYLSADFRMHATSVLIAGMLEAHDKSRFETTGISLRDDNNSEMRQRVKASFEHFHDAETLSDEEIAAFVRESEIDLLIDLMGFTAGSRTRVMALRPAPIQVSYLGFAGTMGAPYIDYIVADRIVIPKAQQEFYSEKVVTLPDSYQANDVTRLIADREFTRSELGLPAARFVFCCFNNNYKILPRIFDCWMRILRQVEGSVLWLLEDNPKAADNLAKEAVARGVDADRLIFAKRMPLSEHLARHRLADLFLDTLPFNAHTTASDALWAGLPVLTCLGETFASRVAASLLNAICLPELITTTMEAYEQMAVDLALHPEKIAVIKRKLAENRLTTPLFDTKRFTRHIEAAYTAMYERHQAGLPPDHIAVSD